MSNMNHAICERCWFSIEGNTCWDGPYLEWVCAPVRHPSDDVAELARPCCFCANATILGAFIRSDPKGLACQRYGYHAEDAEDAETKDSEMSAA